LKDWEKIVLLKEMLTVINSAGSPEELLSHLLDKCIEITGALTGSIAITDPDTEILDIRISRGFAAHKMRRVRLKVGEGVTGQVAKTGQPLLINDVEQAVNYVTVRGDLKSELAVPLKINDEIIGVISVDSNRSNAFEEQHIELISTVAGFAAQIFEKVRLIGELRDKVERQNLLLEITRILEEDLEIGLIFKKIMRALAASVRITRGMLVLLNRDDKLEVFTGYRLSQEAIKRGVYQIGEGITGKVYQTGRSIQIEDISKSKEFLNRMRIRRGRGSQNSFFAVPIRYENKTVGVLSAEKKYVTESDFKSTHELLTLISTIVSNKVHTFVIANREREELLRKNTALKERLVEKESGLIFIGKNEKVVRLLETARLIADTDATVLVTGGTGTGKEVLARLLHNKSRRWDKPFVSINCAAIPEQLLESELFGYVAGAFTGAVKSKKGRFVLADEGTIFLDEVGDLNFNLQAKILRVLQDRTLEPLGSEGSVTVDVRVIAATNQDLDTLVSEKSFREDLFYRLNVINLNIPPLSERRDDIPLFLDYFIALYNEKYGKSIEGVSQRFAEAMMRHSWPGNIRELQNVVERAVLLAGGSVLDSTLIPAGLSPGAEIGEDDGFRRLLEKEIHSIERGEVYWALMSKVEKYLIDYALVQANNKQIEAADYLGIHRNTLYMKLKEEKKPFRFLEEQES
jgi:Nif-specific regulatory protein